MILTKQNFLRRVLLGTVQLLAIGAFAQSPALINYQGAARLADGTPLDNRTISLKFELHAGAPSGSIVATEVQTVQTNLLGLFTTQIGKNTNISAINWQSTLIFLEVSMDTSAGSNFTSLGTQQLVSAPYALHASSVPSSYTNNVLSIGSSSYALSQTVTAVPNTNITVSGLGTVTSVGTNTFDINIAAPTFSNSGQAIVTGVYPTFVVNTPTVPAAITPSIALTTTAALTSTVVSSGSSFSLNVAPPTFSNTSQNIITGSYPNFIVNTPTVSAAALPTLVISNTTAATSTVASSGNSFSINVAPPTFTNAGPATITGAYPSFTINSAVPTTYTNGAGISITSGSVIANTAPNITPTVALTTNAAAGASVSSSGSSFSLNVPAPTFTNSGPATITGAYPNFTINSSVGVTYTNGTGIGITSGSIINTAPDQVVAFTNSGPSTISGTYPNFVINSTAVPNTSVTVTATSAAGPSVTSAGTNSFNINIPTSSDWTLLGNLGTSTATNFIGTTDNVALMFRTNNQKSGAIDQILSNVYFGNQSGLSNTTGSLNAGFGQEALKSLTTPNRNSAFGYQALTSNTTGGSNTGIGASALRTNTSGNDNTALGKDALFLNLTGSSNVGIGAGVFLNHSTGDNNVAVGRDALNGNLSGANNVVIGSLAGYTNTSGSNNVFIGFSAGYNEPGSNKFVLANTSTSTTPLMYGDFASGRLGINTTTLGAYNLNIYDVGTSSALRMSNSTSTSLGFVIGNNNANVSMLNYENTPLFLGTNGINRMVITNTGSVGIGLTTPAAFFHISNSNGDAIARVETPSSSYEARMEFYKFGGVFGAAVGFYPGNASLRLRTMSAAAIVFEPNGVERMRVEDNGRVGIGTGTTAPTATLHVAGTTRLVDGTQGLGKVLTSDASGNASWATAPGWGTSGNVGTTAGTNFIGTTDAQDVVFKSNSTEVFRAQSSGVLRFSNASSHTISVQSPASNAGGIGLLIKAGDATGGGFAQGGADLILQGGDQYNQTFTPYTAGNVVLRSGKNQSTGTVNDGGAIIFQNVVGGTNTYTECGRFDVAGDFIIKGSATKPGGGSWTATSDARLKTNVHTYTDGLAEIMKIKPVWYTYTGEAGLPKETYVGVIAQDLQTVSPYMVKEWTYKSTPSSDGTNYLSVDNSAMTYMMINAIKEQQKQIEELKKQSEEQKQLINELLKK